MVEGDLIVGRAGGARWNGRRLLCALGRGGRRRDKREGDGATPVGAFAMRELLYRADRHRAPPTRLPARPIGRDDGWCDAPGDPAYNRAVRLPHGASAERLWRQDHVYDLIVPLGYNDDPVRAGAGSAIFLHVAQPDFAATAGCVALAAEDLLRLLAELAPGARVVVEDPADPLSPD